MASAGLSEGAHVQEVGEFGDPRLSKRFRAIVEALERHPDESFPSAMERAASLEGLYRFLANPRVTSERVLAPHVASTVDRARGAKEVIAIHDTTEIAPPGATAADGFYDLQKGRCGFLAHFTLLVAADEPCPLGVSGFSVVPRSPRVPQHSRDRWADAEKESRRWWTCADQVAAQVGDGVEVLHVMDREADSYEIFAMLMREDHRFVIRLHHDRLAAFADIDLVERLSAVLPTQALLMEREVQLSARKGTSVPDKKRKHPARVSRTAKLQVRAAQVAIQRPRSLPAADLPASLPTNVVFVTEPAAPNGVEPVVWKLLTTLPINTPEQVAKVIDTYRGRWLIEEYFKALKTGCAFEKRPLESLKTCSTALALFVPIAVQMLLLRFLARRAPKAPASAVFTSEQIAAVRRLAASDRRLPPRASVQHMMLAIAGFGGHLKSNGDPGWQVLGRGYLRLCERMFPDAYRSSQSHDRRGS
jgi:hypothetical protein